MRDIGKSSKQPARKVTLILLLAWLCTAALGAAEWHVEVADPLGGYYSSLQIDSKGNAHVAHAHPGTRALKYSFWDKTLQKWFTTILDQTGGFCSLALDSKGRPHISYLEYGTEKLKYAHWTGGAWEKQTIQIRTLRIDFYTSIALDRNDNPSISYYEYQTNSEGLRLNLRNVAWNGQAWEVRTVDTDRGSGKFNSLAIDSAGHPHVAYANVAAETASLRYGRWDGQSWVVEVLEGFGISGYTPYSVSLVLDKDDNPHIAYTDAQKRLVKYASRRAGKWEFKAVDMLGKEAYPDRNGIGLDDKGRPYISYYDAALGQLKMAHEEGGKWVAELVDGNAAGFTSSLRIADGAIWITYSDEAQQFKVARRPLNSTDSAHAQASAAASK